MPVGLRWLDLSGNGLTDVDAAKVLLALRVNKTLLALDLSGNAIGLGRTVQSILTGKEGFFFTNDTLQVQRPRRAVLKCNHCSLQGIASVDAVAEQLVDS